MKPKISAFSGRVTLFEVRNISCASTICSLWKIKEEESSGEQQFTLTYHKNTRDMYYRQMVNIVNIIMEVVTQIAQRCNRKCVNLQ